jgi:hypothetical protein
MMTAADRNPHGLGLRLWLSLAASLLVLAVLALPASARPSEEPFALENLKVVPSTLQAGAHADLTFTFDVAHDSQGHTFNDARNIVTELPAGFIGNNTAVPTCTDGQLVADIPCFPAAAVGTIAFDYAGERVEQPLFNMQVTSPGVAAELGYLVEGAVPEHLVIRVRPSDLGLTVTAPEISPGDVRDVKVVIWGVPGAAEHDLERQRICGGIPFGCVDTRGGPVSTNVPPLPYLSNATSCGEFTFKLSANSWETPESWSEGIAEVGPTLECERLPFRPSIVVQPTTTSAETATGLKVSVLVPQNWDDPSTLSTSDLKDAVVSLPQGMTINPSSGSGLAVCTQQEYEAEGVFSVPGEHCPSESKIGSIEIETPLLDEKAVGGVYIAQPFHNQFGSLLSFYVVARIRDRGVIAKVAGEVHLDRETGQVVTSFLNNPQVPFSRFTLEFHSGPTAPLVSPPGCGSYATQASFTPWSAPGEPRLASSQPFDITSGVRGGACPSGGVPSLKPSVVAGMQNGAASAYSPFYLRIGREDGEQELTKFSTVMPPGLTGNLTGVPFCPDSAIEAARQASGQQEIDSPSCPAASEIGHTLVGAGVGTVLAWTPGKLYLAGPYHGSSLSIVSITSATVGPFDLGTVVIRFALRINKTTAQVEVDSTGSDPIPHIIKGIVVHVKDIRVYIDRSKFMINPTSCEHMQIQNAITGAGEDVASSADDQTVSVTTPFQAADCSSLKFNPRFQVSTSGHPTRKSGEALHVKLTVPPAPQGTMANIAKVKVALPKPLPSRLETLQKACLDSVFNSNPAACPVPSRVGTATATTPILPVPLNGPVYFVSHGARKFPDLVIVLQGYGITVNLDGETFISKKGLTSTTFRTIPDVPVGTFELSLPQGPYSALAANGNPCTVKGGLKMPTSLVAQNGTTIHQSTPIAVSGCPKHAKHHSRRHGKHKKRK